MNRLTRPLTTLTALALATAILPASASAAPPAITQTTFSHVRTEAVTLEATLDPQGKVTSYHFEYGTSPCTEEPDPCAALPEGTPILGSSPPVTVSAELKGLSPGTTYHFRLIAENNDAPHPGVQGPDTVFATYRLPPVFGPCPQNEAFRSNHPSAKLPDCRAYEQATPTDKNGGDARGVAGLVRTSPQGDRISFLAHSPLSDAAGSQTVPIYLSTRSGAAWSTQGLLPPETLGAEASVMGWTPDLSQVFDSANRFSGVGGATLLARSSADGSLTTVVPYGEGLTGSNLFYAGAGGNEVLFESPDKLASTPAAIQGKSNLYLWDRVSGQVTLAGVMNDEAPPPAGAFAGPYDWIRAPASKPATNEGGSAAAYYTQDEKVISADGQSIYFTAGKTGQLYLRINPTQPQSALNGNEECTEPTKACTLHVSATEKTNGTGGGPDPAGERPAAFVQATTEGSKTLFTSSEKLTDDANTGPEVLPPAIARAKLSDGSEKSLSFRPAHAQGITVDGSHIYWADPEDGTIGRAELGGGHPEPEFIDKAETEAETEVKPGVFEGISKPQYVAVDGEHIYWSNAADGQVGTGTIGCAKLGSTEAEEVKPEFITGATDPQGVAVNSEYVYWANAGLPGGGGFGVANRTIGRAKLGSGGAEEVQQTFIQVDETASEDRPQGIAIDAAHIYVAVNSTSDASRIYRYTIDGNPASQTQLFNGKGSTNEEVNADVKGAEARGIALDSTYLYWTRPGRNAIGRVKLSDFEERELAEFEFVKAADHPLGLALDGSHLYWTANQGTPPNPGNDLYRWDADAPESQRLSDLTAETKDPDGAQVVGVLGASEDLSTVYFAANGVLAANTVDNGAGPETAQVGDCEGTSPGAEFSFSGQCSLYLAREGEPITYLGRLDASAPHTVAAIQSDAADWLPHGQVSAKLLLTEEKTARVSADGDTLLFRSQAKLTPYDNHGVPELYRYRVGEGIACVSCNPTGEAPSGSPSFGSISFGNAVGSDEVPLSYTLSRNLSADGNRVFFETPDRLVAEDTNGEGGCPQAGSSNGNYPACLDVYEWEAQGTGSCTEDVQGGGCLYLLSSGKSADASFFGDADEEGENAFIFSRDPLVPQDQDQLNDVYDARVGGGLASQNELAPVPCETEACRPAASTPPGSTSPGSASFAGPGNPKPRTARHGKHKRHAKHHHKRHRRRGTETTPRRSR